MRPSTILSCDMCEHNEVCKIKDDYQKFTMFKWEIENV